MGKGSPMTKSKDSIQRQYLLKKLKRERDYCRDVAVNNMIDRLVVWVNKQVERANKKSGGLGK